MKKTAIKSVSDLGPQFTRNEHRMVGQDGAFSIPLNNGQLFVFFGDTIIGARRENESIWFPDGIPVGPKDMTGRAGVELMVNNCGLLIEPENATDLMRKFKYILDESGQIKNLLPLAPDENRDNTRIWCLHGIEIDKKLYLYFVKVEMITEGPFPVNFKIVGSGLTRGNRKDWDFDRLPGKGDDLFWNVDTPRFGSAVLKVPNDPFIYLYGICQHPVSQVQEGFIARVKPEDIEDLRAHSYFAGDDLWSNDLNDAVPIFNDFPNELSVSYNEYLGCYIAVHSHIMTEKVVMRKSQTPWGPWSDAELLFEAVYSRPKPLPYPDLLYAGKEHPWLSKDGGKTIYITYIEFEEYYPHLMEVTFS